MKKFFQYILCFTILLVFLNVIPATSVKAEPSLQILSCDTVVSGVVDYGLKVLAKIKNNGNNNVVLKLRINIIKLTMKHSMLICFGGTCNGAISKQGLTTYDGHDLLNPGADTEGRFTCELDDGFNVGMDKVEFTFYDSLDATNQVSFTSVFNVGETSVVDNNSNLNGVSIYPNPANDNLNISNDFPDNKSLDIEIFNSLSQKVYNFETTGDNKEIIINVKDFENGVYIIRLKSGDNARSGKVIISK
jgi:hypothetical protein